MAKKKSEVKEAKPASPAFTKEALVKSRKYQNHCDLLSAVLEENRAYKIKETDAIISKFMKGKVN